MIILMKQLVFFQLNKLKMLCEEVFANLDVDYCYLFGSYAEGNPHETSDVDLLISTSITGLDYFNLIETLRNKLLIKNRFINC